MSHFSYNKAQHPFFDTLQKRVYDYFENNKIDMSGGWKLWSKAMFYIVAAVVNYWLMVWMVPAGGWSVLLCVTMGLLLAGIGFNVMHDGAHGSFSRYAWVNNVMGFSLNFMGGDVNLWKIKHNLVHHSFTNVEGLDDDTASDPMVGPGSKPEDTPWFQNTKGLYPKELDKNQDSEKKEGGAQ